MKTKDSYFINTIVNRIQTVIINRPNKKNAFNYEMYKELKNILRESAENDDVVAFVLTGNGDFYSSGNDLNAFKDDDNNKSDSVLKTLFSVKDLVDALILYPKLLIAVVNGPAIGIAATTLPLFDIVYASTKVYLKTPFSALNLTAEGCSTYTFPKIMGNAKASQLLCLGYKMNVQEAKECGLVTQLYDDKDMLVVKDEIDKISMLSTESINITKNLMRQRYTNILLKVNETEIFQLIKSYHKLTSVNITDEIVPKSRL